MLRPPLVLRSLGVAVVIGTVLNAINQGDALWAGAPLHAGKICLTYVVPFLVASYGAWAALAARPRSWARRGGAKALLGERDAARTGAMPPGNAPVHCVRRASSRQRRR